MRIAGFEWPPPGAEPPSPAAAGPIEEPASRVDLTGQGAEVQLTPKRLSFSVPRP